MASTLRKTSIHKWQSAMTTTSQCLAYLQSTAALTDVNITFPGCKKTIQSHRWLLSMRSPVFEAMLCGPMAVKDLILPSDNPEAFEWMLEHLYKEDHGPPEDIEIAVQVYLLAHKYQVDAVEERYEKYLQDELNSDNFPIIYNAAVLMESEELLFSCKQFLAVCTDDVLKAPTLGALSRRALRLLLEHRCLAASSETLVFKAIVNWGKAQLINEHSIEYETLKEETQQKLKRLSRSDIPESAMKEILKALSAMDLNLPLESESLDSQAVPAEAEAAPKALTNSEAKEDPSHIEAAKESQSKLRQIVEDFLPAVRYLAIPTEEFVDIMCYDLLTQDEGLAIMKKKRGAPGVILPPFVSQHSVHPRKPFSNTEIISGKDLSETQYTFRFYKKSDVILMQSFQTTHTIWVVGLSSSCCTSLLSGELTICDSKMTPVGYAPWERLSCRFKKPVKLRTGEQYKFTIVASDVLQANSYLNISFVKDDLTLTGQALTSGKIEMTYFLDSVIDNS